MKVIIIGCGRMGSGLAVKLSSKGHNVTVIDNNAEAFEKLGKGFKGKTIAGFGYDKDVLEKAQIEMADAVVACSSNDEVNALIGRISRNIYRVPRVISRLYDPRKAEIYHTLGIQTISTVTWGIDRCTEMLSYNELDSVMSVGDNNVEIVRIEVPALLVGKNLNELSLIGELNVVAISRNNKTFLPTLGTKLQKYDVLYIAVMLSSIDRLKALLGLA